MTKQSLLAPCYKLRAKFWQVVGRTDKEMREERLMRRRQKKAAAESAVSPLPAEAFCCGEVDTTETPHCEPGPAPWNGKAYAGPGAIGRKVRVYWKDDDDWFPGIVAAYDATRPERRQGPAFSEFQKRIAGSLDRYHR